MTWLWLYFIPSGSLMPFRRVVGDEPHCSNTAQTLGSISYGDPTGVARVLLWLHSLRMLWAISLDSYSKHKMKTTKQTNKQNKFFFFYKNVGDIGMISSSIGVLELIWSCGAWENSIKSPSFNFLWEIRNITTFRMIVGFKWDDTQNVLSLPWYLA